MVPPSNVPLNSSLHMYLVALPRTPVTSILSTAFSEFVDAKDSLPHSLRRLPVWQTMWSRNCEPPAADRRAPLAHHEHSPPYACTLVRVPIGLLSSVARPGASLHATSPGISQQKTMLSSQFLDPIGCSLVVEYIRTYIRAQNQLEGFRTN
ncbi:hypothetical protein BC834DRAFT_632573 [Gloeopeniophorella convolvens]|nr:hypothetical protein BC834DRAFT_632573 [Gloeopeniophorella convolvens]